MRFPVRAAFLFLVPLLALTSTVAAKGPATDDAFRAGDHVVVITRQATITRDGKPVDQVHVGQTLAVREVKDDQLHIEGTRLGQRAFDVRSGWIETKRVMPPWKAVAHFKTLVETKPDAGVWWEARANALRASGKHDEAIAEYEKLVASHPDVAIFVNGLGRAFEERGMSKPDEEQMDDLYRAIEDYKKAIELDSGLAIAYANLAAVQMRVGAVPYAQRNYNEVIRLEPNNASAYANRADFSRMLDNMEDCIADCTKALELDPLCIDALETRSLVYYQQKNRELALADMTALIAAAGANDYRQFSLRGFMHNAFGEPDKAIADYQRSLKLNPTDQLTYRHLANIWESKGNPDEAMKVYDALVAAVPKDPEVYITRGLKWFGRKDYDKVIEDARAAVQLDDKHRLGLFLLATSSWRQGELKKSLEHFDAAIKAHPKDAMIINDRGVVRRDYGNYQGALDDFATAIRLHPHLVAAHMHIAMIRAGCPDPKLRDGNMAIRFAQKGLEVSKFENFFCLDALAAAHAEMGDFPLAIKTAERALASIDETRKWTIVEEDSIAEVRARLELYKAKKPFRDKPAKAAEEKGPP